MAGVKTPSVADLASMALMNPQQRQLVEHDIDNLHRAIHGRPMSYMGADGSASGYIPEKRYPDGFRGTLPEPELAKQSLDRDMETLKQGTPPEYSGYTKNELFSLYQQLREKYSEGMLSHGQMWQPTHAHIQHYMAHEEANVHIGKAIANIHRILDPDDEGFSLESLRPNDHVQVNLPMFRQNFDALRFTDETERALIARDLDDETYSGFLRLKLQTSSAKLIQKKLGINQQVFEACEDRLKLELERNPIEDDELNDDGDNEATPVDLEEVKTMVVLALTEVGDEGMHFHQLADLCELPRQEMRALLQKMKDAETLKGKAGNSAVYCLNTDPAS